MTPSAEKNRVGRSAVSQAIRSLEQTLEVNLVIHRKNFFKLTSAGLALEQKCEALFSHVKTIKDNLDAGAQQFSGPLHIGASHSVATHLLPKVFSQFSEKHPRVELHLHVGNGIKIQEMLRSQQIEIGIAVKSDLLAAGPFAQKNLRKGEFYLVKSSSKEVPKVYLIGDQGPEVTAFKKSLLKQKEEDSSRLMNIQSWEVLAALASQGMGTALIPDFMVEKGKNLRKVRNTFRFPYELCAYFNDQAYLTKSSRAFLESFDCAN